MLETTIDQLEKLITDLIQQNQSLRDNCALLEQQLQQARNENDELQLSTLEQEERIGATLVRLQALLQRSNQ